MIRIGNGFDVHKFAEGRELWLCGVKVDHSLGLLGHSDADVALHALCDALLGAAALRDIGYHFPDTDPAYKGADSRRLLRRVVELIAEKGYRPGNVDVTIIAQTPKLLPYIERMRATVASDLGIDLDCVSVKATTTERLGFTGRGEGIAAQASALIVPGSVAVG
ncbi:MAG: 2-C-methyl-D-erythritol 2,4-cyclodiphosphate synthase [Bacteroides sp.]|nr:2-C-methyl-D-erythritol 2,4-cyclodiphosphate synthase [Bacteroides sp.]